MLHLIASSCRLVELDQLFLIPLSGDEEETFKGNWKGLCVCTRVCACMCEHVCACMCVYEVAYTVFRGQRAQYLLRDALWNHTSFLDNVSLNLTSICRAFGGRQSSLSPKFWDDFHGEWFIPHWWAAERLCQYRSSCFTQAVNLERAIIMPLRSLLLGNVSFHFLN